MIDVEALKKIIKPLTANEEDRPTAFHILDFYYKKAKEIPEYEALGELAMKCEYRGMVLKCAENSYIMARTQEQLMNARRNLCSVYNALNMPEKALFYNNINLEIEPDSFDFQLTRAYNLALMNRREESEEVIESLIAKDPKQEENIRFGLSGKLLREGKTTEGIMNFIDTFKPKSELFEDIMKMKKWNGIAMPGSTLYVNGEGGIGDEIINIRFFKHIEDLGMKPILYSPWHNYRPDIVDLFIRNGYDVLCEHYSIDRTKPWIHMMSIPGYMGLQEKDLWKGTYLTPMRQKKNNLKSKKFKIGIKCEGNPYFSQNVYRSIPIETMLEYIPKNDNVEIYFFDKELTYPGTIAMKDKLDTWEDTLDYIDQMDVIVSSCTSIVHAAGAIGKTTCVIVPIAEYYVWTSSKRDNHTPWYGDNFYVMKQTKVRSWDEPLQEMQTLVNKMIQDK